MPLSWISPTELKSHKYKYSLFWDNQPLCPCCCNKHYPHDTMNKYIFLISGYIMNKAIQFECNNAKHKPVVNSEAQSEEQQPKPNDKATNIKQIASKVKNNYEETYVNNRKERQRKRVFNYDSDNNFDDNSSNMDNNAGNDDENDDVFG